LSKLYIKLREVSGGRSAAVDFEILEGMPFALIEKLEFHT
jgi:hypothetical protein